MVNMSNIWYDADTLLEEVLDTMPQDIRDLFETEGNPTERDMDDSWKTQILNEMDIEDEGVDQELQDFYDNACCPDSSVAAARLCGCRGSGDPTNLSEAAQRRLEDRY